jgi:plasmid stability protein
MIERMEDTPTTASYVLTVGLVFALKQEAARRGVSLSELVRDLLTAALAVEKEPVAA